MVGMGKKTTGQAPALTAEEAAERAERATKLAGEVAALLPELREDQVRQMITATINQVTDLTNDVEEHFQQGKKQVDADAIAAVMIQGALAAVCESHQEEDVRTRLYRAGRAVGEFVTERWAKKVGDQIEAERLRTSS